MQKSFSTVEFDLRPQYKSLDDVSLSSCSGSLKCNPRCTQPSLQKSNQKLNCGERKLSLPKALQQCDKTPVRQKNYLIMKKDLQCERCGYVQAFDDGSGINNKWASSTICHLNEEHIGNSLYKDSSILKSTNCKQQSISTNSLNKMMSSASTVNDVNLTIRRRIVYAQLLLEAFGNASNQLNSNSSRFVSLLSSVSRFDSHFNLFPTVFSIIFRGAFLTLNLISKEMHCPRMLVVVSVEILRDAK